MIPGFFSKNKKLVFLSILVCLGWGMPSTAVSQCGVTIPNGERCEAPGGDNCEFYICSQGQCVPSGVYYPSGTKCGCFSDECYEDFCDGTGDCVCGFFAASSSYACASEQNICDGVDHCDGLSGENCNGTTTFPASSCDDGVLCTVDCNPVEGCVTYPIDNLCDDADICTVDVCDTSSVAGCLNTCTGTQACAGSTPCVSFPIEWHSISAKAEGTMLYIEWMTSMEVNNKGFEVELSGDGVFFQNIGFVPGHGTSQDAQFYDFQTLIKCYGTNYVRLKQLDLDGGFSYSRTLEVMAPLKKILSLEAAYPNPFRDKTTVRFSVKEDIEVSLRVYDQSGQEVKVLFEGPAKANEVYITTFHATGLAAGTYFYELVGAQNRIARKLLIY